MSSATREQIIGLLKVAACPASCDNGVVVRDQLHGEIEQCQFCFERLKAIAALQAAEPVAAQVRYRRPEKGLPSWSVWQPSKVDETKPKYHFDEQGWEVEYRLLYTVPQPAHEHPAAAAFSDYDPGLINDHGGGNVGWWQDYIRSEIERANDFWRGQLESSECQPAKAQVPDEAFNIIEGIRAELTWPGWRSTSSRDWVMDSISELLSMLTASPARGHSDETQQDEAER